MEQFSTVWLQIWTVHMISGYLNLENSKIIFGTDLGHFWGTDPFSGQQKYEVLYLWNLRLNGLEIWQASVA